MKRWSDNGWEGIPDRDSTTLVVISNPSLVIRVANPSVGFLFTRFIQRFDAEVEPIESPVLDDWSYAYRNVRGSISFLSCHASGTAVDLNALRHPRGVRNTYSNLAELRVRNLLDSFNDPHTGISIFKWGQDFKWPSKIDSMHFQIHGNQDAVDRVVAKIKSEEEALPSVEQVWSADLIPHNTTTDKAKPVDPANPTWTPISTLEQIDRLVRLQGEQIIALQKTMDLLLTYVKPKA
jgi:hypothetical protein